MPFDFKKFDAKCANMSIDELQREWEHYTRLISGSATSTAVSGAAIPFTLGVSVIGVGLAAPAIHNARKKREIIERHLQRLGTTHHTRKRDVLTPIAISGTVGLVTLGVGSAGAGAITNAAVEHGITSVAANEIAVKATVHLAVDGVAMAGEEHHMKQKRLAEAHNAWLKQQQGTVGSAEKPDQSTISTYDPSTFGNQSQTVTNTGFTGDMKYEYSSVPASSPVSEPVLPPYSPPLHERYQNFFPPPQQYSEKPISDNASNYHPPSYQNFDQDAVHYPPPSEPAPTRPQPHPVQIPSGPAQLFQHNEPSVTKIDFYEGSGSSTYQQSLPTAETYIGQGTQQTQNTHSQSPVQQTPHLMYPSYPTSVIPDSAQQKYGRLDQVMSELTISSIPPPPPRQMDSPASRAQTPKPPGPTSRGYCPQLQQASEQNSSYLPPPSPVAPVSSVCYQQQASTSYLSPPITQNSSTTIPPRSPSISSIDSFQPYSPAQEQSASFNQYGYMTPVPTPGSQYNQTQVQRQSSIFSQYQTQASQSCPAPEPMQPSHTNGYPIPAQTPCYPQPPTPYNYSQSPQQQQQSGYFQFSYSQPSPQTSNQGNWQAPQVFSNTYSPPYANQGYPTPTTTTSYSTEQHRQPMYFPPPPTQPTR